MRVSLCLGNKPEILIYCFSLKSVFSNQYVDSNSLPTKEYLIVKLFKYLRSTK